MGAFPSIIPQLWSSRVIEEMPMLNNAINQGFVEMGVNLDIKAGDVSVRMPILDSAAGWSAIEHIDDNTHTLTPISFTDHAEYAPIVNLGKALSITQYDINKWGGNAMQMLTPQIAQYNVKQLQVWAGYALKGCFDSCLDVTAHSYDASGSGDMSYDTILTGAYTALGENGVELDTIMMHSKVHADLALAGVIQDFPAPNYADSIMSTGMISRIGNRKVVINDTICAKVDTKYPTYLYAGSPIYIGYQKDVTFDTDKNILVGMGTQYLKWDMAVAIGVRGCSYSTTHENPIPANFYDSTHWTLVASQTKLIKLLRILTT